MAGVKKPINIGQIIESKNYGKFEIIGEGNPINNRRSVIVKFLDTGYIGTFEIYQASVGKIKDPTVKVQLDYDPEKIWETHYGPAKIIEDLGLRGPKSNRWVKIKFINTGCEREVNISQLKSGEVRDFSLISAFGVGYLGDYELRNADPIDKILFKRWCGMLNRCYNSSSKIYKFHGALGVKVSNEWLCFATFKHDAKQIPGFLAMINNPSNYNIDKDYLQSNIKIGDRVYSKYTCLWLLKSDNIKLSNNHNTPTDTLGIYLDKNNNFIVKIYNPNLACIHEYGPFKDEISALSFFKYRPGFIHVENNIPNIDNFGDTFISKKQLYTLV